MKKKLLSLVLAGAMVASTSVSAFADEITVDKNGKEHRVDVTGNVENTSGDIVSGTITVTVPTAVSFTIGNDGEFTGGDIEIVNRNSEREKIEVIAKEFNDPNPESGIIIVKDSELDDKINENTANSDKRYISLNLKGDDATVGLISNKAQGKTGFVTLNDESEIDKQTNTSLGKAWEGNNLRLKLTGRVKKSGTPYVAPTNAIKSNFSLVLKIQKAR